MRQRVEVVFRGGEDAPVGQEVDFGAALFRLGERESGTERLEEALVAYHEALRVFTRQRVPPEDADGLQLLR